ncbi:MAG: copper amine oxidase N-terminal domain-containing protein [Bacillota bacterium]
MERSCKLIILLMISLFLVAPGVAGAATSYSAGSVETVSAPKTSPVRLGSLIISFDALEEGEHIARVFFPDGYQLVSPGRLMSLEHPFIDMESQLTGQPNVFYLHIEHEGDPAPATFEVPIRTTVPSGARGQIVLGIEAVAGRFVDGQVVVGRVPGGVVRLSADPAKVGAASTEFPFKIKVAEEQPNVLGSGKKVLSFTLPEGFRWDGAGMGTKVVRDGGFVPAAAIDEADARVLTVDIAGAGRRAWGGFEISGRVLVDQVLPPGSRLMVTAEGDDLAGPVSLALAEFDEPRTEVRFIVGRNDYMVNGSMYTMDAVPYTRDGRLFLPLRYIGLALGINPDDILWDGQKASLKKNGVTVEVQPGQNHILVNGKVQQTDVAAEFAPPGRIMLPYRFVAEAFGANVRWDAETRSVWMVMY